MGVRIFHAPPVFAGFAAHNLLKAAVKAALRGVPALFGNVVYIRIGVLQKIAGVVDLDIAHVIRICNAYAAKEKAGEDMITLAHNTDTEGTIESLVKAKGFEECMVYITEESVNVVVATPGLTPEQAAQINEVVMAESGRAASAVKIVEIKTES